MSLLQSLQIRNLRDKGENIVGSCPSGEHLDRRPSWGIRTDAPHIHNCYACGFRGVLRDLLIRIGGYSLRQAVATVGEETPYIDGKGLVLSTEKKKAAAYEEEQLFPFYISKKALVYVRAIRGISEQTFRACRLLYDGKQDRIVFPWFVGGKLRAVTGRAIKQSDTRRRKIVSYIEGSLKRQLLYLPSGEINKDPLILVEGEFDALKVYDAGFKNVAALGHSDLSDGQRNLMINSGCTEIWIFTDDDKPGMKARKVLREVLSKNKIIRDIDYAPIRKNYAHLRRKDGSLKLDPGVLSHEDIRKVLTPSSFSMFPEWETPSPKMSCQKTTK